MQRTILKRLDEQMANEHLWQRLAWGGWRADKSRTQSKDEVRALRRSLHAGNGAGTRALDVCWKTEKEIHSR
jgi:hypothetical protein